ncbi:glycosyltransferase family 4 protein [Pseudoalteromonas sp. GB56]
MKKVLVLHGQVPFVRGGAELLVEGLVNAINTKLEGVEAELVQLPFKWYPEEQILSDLMAWRGLDLTESNGQKIDSVIGTKFPTYAAKHPNKVTWLVHQHRFFYDLEGSEYDKPILTKSELETRQLVRKLDSQFISESREIFSIANTVTDRLNNFNGINSTVLFPPSALAEKIIPGTYGDYVVCVARVNSMKRQHLLIEAAREMKSDLKIKIVGKGDPEYIKSLEQLIITNQLESKVELFGFVDDEELLSIYANSRAVYYGPIDEDYGYATIEGFLAKKPVVTVTDSGEVARIVDEYNGGWIIKPSPKDIATVLDNIAELSDEKLEEKAKKGYNHAKETTWDNVLEKLVVPFL